MRKLLTILSTYWNHALETLESYYDYPPRL